MTLADAFLTAAARPTIVSDIDNTLAFCAEATATALNARFGTSIVVAQMTYRFETSLPAEQRDWLATQRQRGVFYANLAPDREAIDALAAIHAAGHHVIVSSDRPPETTKLATEAWLTAWGVPGDVQLYGPGGKRQILAGCGPNNPGVLIDDDPAKWLTVARDGVQVWSPARPWTPDGWERYPHVWVFTDWAAVLERLGVSTASTHSEAV